MKSTALKGNATRGIPKLANISAPNLPAGWGTSVATNMSPRPRKVTPLV